MEHNQVERQHSWTVPQTKIGAMFWLLVVGSAEFRRLSIWPIRGSKVFLVDKAPDRSAARWRSLDKTFPSNDCSMCIESPKFIECSPASQYRDHHLCRGQPGEGEAGDFKVKVTKKPRYIIEDKCTGCNICVDYCPVKIPDPFNQELSEQGCSHLLFSGRAPGDLRRPRDLPLSERGEMPDLRGRLQTECD